MCFCGVFLLVSFLFFPFFSNTFLFPEKTSTVTSWSTADIKIDFRSPKKKNNSNFATRNCAGDSYALFFGYTLNIRSLIKAIVSFFIIIVISSTEAMNAA